MRFIFGLIVFGLLSTPALSMPYQPYDLPPSGTTLLKGAGPQTNVWVKDIREIWLDARRSAVASLKAAIENPDIRKAVGEEIDAPGRMCYLWTKVDDRVRQAAKVIVSACRVANTSTPLWVSIMVNNSADYVKEHCNNNDDGKGGKRPKNLGLRYLEEEKKATQNRAFRMQLDAMAREDFDLLKRVLRGMAGARIQGIPSQELLKELDGLQFAH